MPVPGQGRPVDVVTVVGQAVAVSFAAAAVLADALLRASSGPGRALPGTPDGAARGSVLQVSAADVVENVLGVGWSLARASGRVVEVGLRITGPVLTLALDPPLVPTAIRPRPMLRKAVASWREQRPGASDVLARWSSTGLTEAVSAVLGSVDVQQLVWEVLDRLDLDRTIAGVVERVDLDAVAARVLAQIDLEHVIRSALEQVDLDALASTVVDRMDLDVVVGQVITDLDVPALVDQAMAPLDLTALVVERADLGGLVNSALDELDLTELIMRRVDLPRLADYVVEAIDLPELVRESTGGLAAETVREIRLQGVDADRAVSRVVDKLLLRRRERRTDAVDLLGTEPPP
jgi:hypothetical protein